MVIFEDTLIEGDIFAFPGVSRTLSFASVVQRWSNRDVLHWMEGIDGSVSQYRDVLERSQIDGRGLLMLDEDGILDLGVTNFGVAKMIFQAVQLLNDFCYNIGEENLQTLCLNVCVCVRQLNNDMELVQRALRPEASQHELVSLNNIVFFSVCQVIEQLKKVLVWLDRSPFDRVLSFIEFRSSVMEDCLSLLRAVCDPYLNRHLSDVVESINKVSRRVFEKCDSVVTTSLDPMVSYTTFFETAILRKTKDFPVWGFNLQSSYRGMHVICEVKLHSPADASGKVDAGDEILQINGETVIGWELRKVATRLSSFTLNECCRELVLLVNKRPREPTLVPRLPRPGLKVEPTTMRAIKRKLDALNVVITEENDHAKRRSKQEPFYLSMLPESAMTTSSTSTDFLTGEAFFDNQIRLIRRATISCGTPPPLIRVQPSVDRSQSLTIPLMMMGMEEDLSTATREMKMAEETGMQVEMVIRRRRTMRQQPGGYVKSFIDNQPVCELQNDALDSSATLAKDEDTGSACTSIYIGKDPLPLDETESEKEPDRYAVIDVVDQCDIDLLHLPPVDSSEWSSSLHLPLSFVAEDQASSEHESTSIVGDDISTKSYAETPLVQPEILWQPPYGSFHQRVKPFLSSLKSTIHAPIAETDETSIGWDSDEGSEENSPKMSCNDSVPSTSRENPCSDAVANNALKDLSHIPCAKLQGKQLEGWIRRKRLEHESSSSKWIKCWMVLHSGVLYLYQNQNSVTADIVIAVAKFIVSDAPKLKTSKKYVFRLCRKSSAFYFAAYKFSDMKSWMNKLGLAAICYDQTAAELEQSDTLSRSMVYIASVDGSLRSPVFSSSMSSPVHHTLPRVSAGNSAARRIGRIPRQNSLRSPRSFTCDADSMPTTSFVAADFFRRSDFFEN